MAKSWWYVIALLFFGANCAVYSADSKAFALGFTKIAIDKSRHDTVSGTIFSFGTRTLIKVYSPRNQFMQIDSNVTLIYNPDEHLAMRIRQNNPALIPFFQVFRLFLQGDQLPALASCDLGNSVKRGDTLRADWIPNGKKTAFRGKISTVYFKDRPLSVDTYDKKGDCLYTMRFFQDSLIGGHHVPLRIVTKALLGSDSLTEDVSLRIDSLHRPIPEEIIGFKVPPEIPVKDLK
jgi:hypothetical protein